MNKLLLKWARSEQSMQVSTEKLRHEVAEHGANEVHVAVEDSVEYLHIFQWRYEDITQADNLQKIIVRTYRAA